MIQPPNLNLNDYYLNRVPQRIRFDGMGQVFNYNQSRFPAFGAGKVYLYLDSDGTHFPEDNQNILKDKSNPVFRKVKETFERLNAFIQRSNGEVELNVTTGRNRGEYKHFLKLLQNAGIKWIIPERLITKNGGDVFLKETAHTSASKIKPEWPSANHIDRTKRDKIEKLANWDSSYIMSSVMSTLEDWDFPVLYTSSCYSDYGSKSFKPYWKAIKDDFNDSWTAFIRQDGGLNFFVGLPIDGNIDLDVKEAILTSIRQKLDARNIKYDLLYRDRDSENSNGPSITITPIVEGKKLDKVYDVKMAIEKAMKEDDLVIVGGNGSNDRTMLDPDTYRAIFGKSDLPLRSVVVADNDILKSLADPFKNKDESKDPVLVVNVGQYELLEGIKKSIKNYAATHSEFRKHLAPELLEEIQK